MKLAVLGGGSTYTPELLSNFLEAGEAVPVSTVVLYDINRERLETVGRFCRGMAQERGGRVEVVLSAGLDEALSGADFVVNQIRVGGNEARHFDIRLGLSHGVLGQETTGVGGFALALRTIPTVLDLCREVERLAPDAWFIDFTNPVGIVTEAIFKYTGLKAVGLCNNAINLQHRLAELLGSLAEQIVMEYAGLNHLAWVRRVWLDGSDATERALDVVARDLQAERSDRFSPSLLSSLGLIPISYLRYFYHRRSVVEHLLASPRTRAQEVLEIEQGLMAHYRTATSFEKPEALTRRGGLNYSRAALELVRGLVGRSGSRQIVNVPNNGALPDLPPGVSVEVPAMVGNGRVEPIACGRVPTSIRGLMSVVKAYETLTVEAAVERSRAKATVALMNHPLIMDWELAEQLVEQIDQEYSLGLA